MVNIYKGTDFGSLSIDVENDLDISAVLFNRASATSAAFDIIKTHSEEETTYHYACTLKAGTTGEMVVGVYDLEVYYGDFMLFRIANFANVLQTSKNN